MKIMSFVHSVNITHLRCLSKGLSSNKANIYDETCSPVARSEPGVKFNPDRQTFISFLDYNEGRIRLNATPDFLNI